jgi:putative transcriptional regulator
MTLAKNQLKTFREARGLTQEKLAARVQVSRQTIISIEGARYVPSLELALRFGQVFGCPVEELFGIPEVQHVREA